MDSLWGNLDLKIIDKSPKMILQEQLNHLKNITDGMVEGELIQKSCREVIDPKTGEKSGFNFLYTFNLKSKYIKNFRYHILTIGYGVTMYPVYLLINMDFALKLKESIAKEFPNMDALDESDFEEHGEIFMEDETEYIKLLSIILKSKEVMGIISNIKLIADEQFSNLL